MDRNILYSLKPGENPNQFILSSALGRRPADRTARIPRVKLNMHVCGPSEETRAPHRHREQKQTQSEPSCHHYEKKGSNLQLRLHVTSSNIYTVTTNLQSGSRVWIRNQSCVFRLWYCTIRMAQMRPRPSFWIFFVVHFNINQNAVVDKNTPLQRLHQTWWRSLSALS